MKLLRRHLPLLFLAGLLAACAATPAPEPEPRVYLVFFEVDSYELTPAARQALEKLPQRVIRNPQAKVTIEGHTDAVGSVGYNMKLGEQRAGAVLAYLTSEGIPMARITTVSFGAEAADALGTGERASALLRRVVVRVD
jgi:peptidoglycan-associated lipoprotein